MQTRTGLIAAGILIVAGAALLVGAVIGQQFQSQARNSGEAAVGVVSSVDDGRATIEYGVGDQLRSRGSHRYLRRAYRHPGASDSSVGGGWSAAANRPLLSSIPSSLTRALRALTLSLSNLDCRLSR